MDNILSLTERVDIAIEIGESYYREFKSGFEGPPGNKHPRDVKEIRYDIAKTLVAFANADGGELFVGIEDDNSVTGMPHGEGVITKIMMAHKESILSETPIPIKKASVINYNGLKVAYFSVNKGTEYVHLTSKGECFQRKDIESVPTASESILLQREEKLSREYDREFVELANVTDLDHALLTSVASRISKLISPEKLLQYLELAEFDGTGLRLRRAALLLFAKKATRWHPRSQVRIFKVRGTEEKTGEEFNITEVGEANGNIFELIEGSWDLLLPHLTDTKLSKDAVFKTQIMYPELACREALINAITHRDYSSEGRGIEVKVFDDRLTISNPGQLLSSITIEDLEGLTGAHQSRNTFIARVLRETGYIRELGEGMRRIFELMSKNDMVEPMISSSNKTFSITLFHRYVYSKDEQLMLDAYNHLNLSRAQKTVVRLGAGGRLISAKEIFDAVGIVDEKDYRELLESLRDLGILSTLVNRNQLTSMRKKYGGSRKAVPRFAIKFPGEESVDDVDDSDTSEYSQIYVGNLPLEVTEEDVLTALQKFGEISDVSIPRAADGRSKGYCIVEFDKKVFASNALNASDPVYINGRKLYLRENQSM